MDPDPAQGLRSGRIDRAIWREDAGFVLGTSRGGWGQIYSGWQRDDLRAEAALRRVQSAPWQLVVEIPPPDPQAQARSGRNLAMLLAVMFCLDGVVLGVGMIVRDRDSSILEAELALPVPAWIHGTTRLLTAGIFLSLGYGATLLLLHSLSPIPDGWRWAAVGSMAALAAAALGVGSAIGRDGSLLGGASEGFSGPLSRALTLTTALLVLGWQLPALGRYLPIAALGARARDGSGSPLVLLSTAALCLCVIWLSARAVRR